VTDELTQAREELRTVARALLAKSGPRPDWQLLVGSGWPGLEIAPELGGSGATFAEVAVIATELGRAIAVSPLLGTVVLGVGLLAGLSPAAGRDELLRGIAAGSSRVAVAMATGDDAVTGDAAPFRIQRVNGRLTVHGTAWFVPDAMAADYILLLGREDGGRPVAVRLSLAELRARPQPVTDETRQFTVVEADGAPVSSAAVWQFAGDPEAAVAALVGRAALAVACDSLGVAEAMLEATVRYAGKRYQFGRPIGSFQAVKHACADMLVQVSMARELVRGAASAVAGDAAGALVAVSMAKSYACAAAVSVAGKAIQLHGGIGYTWEAGLHAYLKRAALNRSLFGSPAAHRQRLAQRYA
jgi:alkylation response protein AidB-like acyl-CoA dehydrogenase